MGAMIQIKYDDTIVSEQQATTLAEQTRHIVINTTGIKDVFVYADSPRIKVAVAPIEIFIDINAKKITDADALAATITNDIQEWKRTSSFPHPINITVIPADWHFKLGV
jgi:hypothetical protein